MLAPGTLAVTLLLLSLALRPAGGGSLTAWLPVRPSFPTHRETIAIGGANAGLEPLV
jgi:hypothetical protein